MLQFSRQSSRHKRIAIPGLHAAGGQTVGRTKQGGVMLLLVDCGAWSQWM